LYGWSNYRDSPAASCSTCDCLCRSENHRNPTSQRYGLTQEFTLENGLLQRLRSTSSMRSEACKWACPQLLVWLIPTSAVVYQISSDDFCRAMLCKRGLCRHSVSVRPSVCLFVCPSVTFMDSVKTVTQSCPRSFSPSGSQTILFFSCQTLWQYSDGNPQVGR